MESIPPSSALSIVPPNHLLYATCHNRIDRLRPIDSTYLHRSTASPRQCARSVRRTSRPYLGRQDSLWRFHKQCAAYLSCTSPSNLFHPLALSVHRSVIERSDRTPRCYPFLRIHPQKYCFLLRLSGLPTKWSSIITYGKYALRRPHPLFRHSFPCRSRRPSKSPRREPAD